jgi:DNA-binding MarR family transcriptional regulator
LKAPVFDPQFQANSLESKIVVALERLAEVFRVLLRDAGKSDGLSPLQVQILTFCSHHEPAMCRVHELAREFNMTRPTISDAVRVLVERGYLHRSPNMSDARSQLLQTTSKGQSWVKDHAGMMQPLFEAVRQIHREGRQDLYGSLLQLIATLQTTGHISLHRMCFTCVHYRRDDGGHYCRLLEKNLETMDLRIDCPEHAMEDLSLICNL